MSLNWVMLDGPQSFVRLPREKILYTSPPRTALALSTPSSYPGKEPLSIKCSDGKAIITNQRLIYLPTTPTPTFQSLSTPLPHLHDTHVSAPFFGPNAFDALLQPVPGGGIPQHHTLIALKLTFKEGGAFDFSTTFERIKEVLGQAVEVAMENGRGVREEVDLEELPRYEEAAAAGAGTGAEAHIQRPIPVGPGGVVRPRPAAPPANNAVVGLEERPRRPGPAGEEHPVPPSEPPPGYEEVQGGSVVSRLERRVEEKA